MAHERDPAVFVALLFEPGQPESVGVQSRDDIIEAIAVDVIYTELGAAGAFRSAPAAEGLGMVDPRPLAGRRRRLLPPSSRLQDVDASVAVHVASSETVSVRQSWLRNRVHDPRPSRIDRIGTRICERTRRSAGTSSKDQLGLTIAVDVSHQHQFAV